MPADPNRVEAFGRAWYGYPIGRWGGNAFAVETAGFNEGTLLSTWPSTSHAIAVGKSPLSHNRFLDGRGFTAFMTSRQVLEHVACRALTTFRRKIGCFEPQVLSPVGWGVQKWGFAWGPLRRKAHQPSPLYTRLTASAFPMLIRLSASTPARPSASSLPDAAVQTTPQSVSALEYADAPFASRPPGLRFLEPAASLQLLAFRTSRVAIRHRHLFHPFLFNGSLLRLGIVSGVRCRQFGHAAESLLVRFHGASSNSRSLGR